jgi:hypothetical protein
MDDLSKKPTIESVKDNFSYAEGHTEVRNIAGRVKPESLCNLTEEETKRLEKKLVRKLDLFILPTIGILYILNYIDRQNLSAAKLQGIMEDLNMNEQQFRSCLLVTSLFRYLQISSLPRSHDQACTSALLWLFGVAYPRPQRRSRHMSSFSSSEHSLESLRRSSFRALYISYQHGTPRKSWASDWQVSISLNKLAMLLVDCLLLPSFSSTELMVSFPRAPAPVRTQLCGDPLHDFTSGALGLWTML